MGAMWGKKPSIRNWLMGAVTFCFLTAIYLGTSSMPTSNIKTSSNKGSKYDRDPRFPETSLQESQLAHERLISKENAHKEVLPSFSSKYHLAVIVPFRERFEELLTFAPYLHKFLGEKKISHDIIIVNQVDSYRFNRASLINAGFLYATGSDVERKCDYIGMHDVDLLPLNKELPYGYPGKGSVMHVAGPGLHPKYNYPNFIGGILLVSVEDFVKVDGMSNVYWGWGMEDDEFFVRLKQNDIKVNRPLNIATGRTDTFRHIHSPKIRPRDTQKCFNQMDKTRRRDRVTGVKNLNYTFISKSSLTIDTAPVTVLNVKLHCDLEISPWCDCSTPNQNDEKKTAPKKKGKLSQNSKINSNNKSLKKQIVT